MQAEECKHRTTIDFIVDPGHLQCWQADFAAKFVANWRHD